MRLLVVIGVIGLSCVGCVTTGTDGQSQLATGTEQAKSAEPQQGKQSLNKMLDKQDTVTLVDEKTGKTKLICRRAPVMGSRLGGRKVCATRKEWDEQRRKSQDNLDSLQRGLSSPGQPGN